MELTQKCLRLRRFEQWTQKLLGALLVAGAHGCRCLPHCGAAVLRQQLQKLAPGWAAEHLAQLRLRKGTGECARR